MGSLLLANPKRRKRRKSVTKRKSIRRRRNPVAKVTKRRRRVNPALKTVAKDMMGKVGDAAVGAGGAILMDMAVKRIPYLTPAMTSGYMGAATKGVVSLGIGMLVSKFLKMRRIGTQLAVGGMTVAFYDAGKVGLKQAGVNVSGMGDYGSLLGNSYYNDQNSGMDYYQAENSGLDYYGASETYDSGEIAEMF
jgi:hypothetical protein